MRFNIRVYGILINDRNEILLSDEIRDGYSFTKFPGGGLEFGEGTKDCLKRELKEELGLQAEIGELVYVNDFFQQSAFRKEDQIISFYYRIEEINFEAIDVRSLQEKGLKEGESFRWKSLKEIGSKDLTFPIDRFVVEHVL